MISLDRLILRFMFWWWRWRVSVILNGRQTAAQRRFERRLVIRLGPQLGYGPPDQAVMALWQRRN